MTSPQTTSEPDDLERLHALADHRMTPSQDAALRALLSHEDLETVAGWERQRDHLRNLHAERSQDATPQALREAARRLQAQHDRRADWSRWGGMAAGLLLAFGLGWGLHGQWGDRPLTASSSTGAPLAFAQQAAVAYAVFQPEQRHPVEVTAAQQDHLVQWLSKRLERPLKVPVLQAQGFELVGGRLLPGATGARAQFMYQNASGQRITLYLGAVTDGAPSPETAFRFHTEGAVASFYWVDQGFGYALSGDLPRAALLALATTVHGQL